MYQLIQEIRSGSSESTTVLAGGFHYSSDAYLALAQWIQRNGLLAQYRPESASWHYRDQETGLDQTFRIAILAPTRAPP